MDEVPAQEQVAAAVQGRSRLALYGAHVVTAFIVFTAQSVIRDEATLNAWMFLLGFVVLAVWLFSIIQTVRLGTPRWQGVALTLLLFPGCAVPFIGPLVYLGISLVCIASTARLESGKP